MNTFFQSLGSFYSAHEGVCNLLGMAAVLNMPPAKNVVYKWLRDTLQSFVGALRPHTEPTANPTIPQPK